MAAEKVEFLGKVARQTIDIGSKSERDAIVLKLGDGVHYVLRSAKGPSFGDTGFESLVGALVKVSGTAIGRTLIVRNLQRLRVK